MSSFLKADDAFVSIGLLHLKGHWVLGYPAFPFAHHFREAVLITLLRECSLVPFYNTGFFM
jgi:hypothetical protein